ncbi:hypothetical protein FIBSPDRAFT_341319 [Athelia psychrophila]|uniref:Uncharacterized protein n=1 Tax=Athelia psychrophila TaxID=1759441 RepID=A0A166Q043_9AGAM|nr:hypothetical protein FIBSPDRAFT_341319 [Fibularhizoctonia sp. CBS 109695]
MISPIQPTLAHPTPTLRRHAHSKPALRRCPSPTWPSDLTPLHQASARAKVNDAPTSPAPAQHSPTCVSGTTSTQTPTPVHQEPANAQYRFTRPSSQPRAAPSSLRAHCA